MADRLAPLALADVQVGPAGPHVAMRRRICPGSVLGVGTSRRTSSATGRPLGDHRSHAFGWLDCLSVPAVLMRRLPPSSLDGRLRKRTSRGAA
jgi:hypothetical protein